MGTRTHKDVRNLASSFASRGNQKSQSSPVTLLQNASTGSSIPPVVHEALRSSSHALDGETRTFMEPRFGHDLSQVRVHTDAKAAESARARNGRSELLVTVPVSKRGEVA